jgi:hypothetical protein
MNQAAVENIVKAFAADTLAPMEMVLRLYQEAWAEYSKEARILDYVALFAERRVRQSLRSGHNFN